MKSSGIKNGLIAGLKKKKDGSYSISIECPSGNVSTNVLRSVTSIAEKYGARVHLTTVQKIMLLDLNEKGGREAMRVLKKSGIPVKSKRTLSQAMVCVGKPYCPLGLQETMPLARYLYDQVSHLEIPPKLKMAISGCPACCSWANMVDVGFVGTRKGFKVLIGGHGGYKPVVGKLLGTVSSKHEIVEVVRKATGIFIAHTRKRGRMSDVIDKLGLDFFKKEIPLSMDKSVD